MTLRAFSGAHAIQLHGNTAPEAHGSGQDEMAEVEAEADKAATEERAAAETAARLARLQAAGLEVWPAGQAQVDVGKRACQ